MTRFDPIGGECLGSQSGTEVLQQFLMGMFGVTDLGTFGCRTIKGSSTLSFHAEGRAGDVGGSHGQLSEVAEWLVSYSEILGIQEVIFDSRIWRSFYLPPSWRGYSGVDNHATHVHWVLNWEGARTLTLEGLEKMTKLSDDDLKAIAKVVEEQIRAHLGFVGSNDRDEKRKLTVVNAVVRGLEASVRPEFLK